MEPLKQYEALPEEPARIVFLLDEMSAMYRSHDASEMVKGFLRHLRFFRIPYIAAGTFIIRDLLSDISQQAYKLVLD